MRSTFVLALVASVAVAAQTPQRPVFRGEAVLVNVDAYPTRDGQVVQDLKPGDFEVFEDGVPQKVENFEFIHIDTSPADTARRDPNTKEEGDARVADPHNRAFVVYFDYYHMSLEGSRNMRSPLKQFLERVIGPTDYVAAMTPDTSIHDLVFAQRLETLEHDIDFFWKRVVDVTTPGQAPNPVSAHEELLELCFVNRTADAIANAAIVKRLFHLWRLDAVLTGLEELIVHLPNLRDERTNVFLFSGGWALAGPDEGLQNRVWGRDLPPPRLGPVMVRRPEKAACDAELLRLASIDFRSRFQTLIDAAKRTNVAISTIDPAGLGAYDFDIRNDTRVTFQAVEARLGPLRTIAANTGGTAVLVTSDLWTPLRKIADLVSSYYLLGYYTTNTKVDGKYRKIEVKVRVPGVSVAARKGYVAPTAALIAARDAAAAARPAVPAGPSPLDDALRSLSRLQTPQGLFVEGAVDGGELVVVAEIAAAQWSEWPKGADIQVVVTGAGGAKADLTRGRIEAGARAALVRVPFGATAGPWRATVELRGSGDPLSTSVDIAAPAATLLGDPLLFRATPSAQSPLRPVADHAFRRTERVHVEWTVREPIERRVGRLLDRKGQPLAVEVTLTERDVAGRPILAADVNLAPLAPADYAIEVVIGRGDRTERRLIAIRVER